MRPKPREITLIDAGYHPRQAELEEYLRADVPFEELAAMVARPVKIRDAMPRRKPS